MATVKERVMWRHTFEALASIFLVHCQCFTNETDDCPGVQCTSPKITDVASSTSAQDQSSCLAPLPHITGPPRRHEEQDVLHNGDVSRRATERTTFLTQEGQQTAVRRTGAGEFYPVHRTTSVVAQCPSRNKTSTLLTQMIHRHARRALARHTTTQRHPSADEREMSPPGALRRTPCNVPPGPTDGSISVRRWLPVRVQPSLPHSLFLCDGPATVLSSITDESATVSSVSIYSDEADLLTCESTDDVLTPSSLATTVSTAHHVVGAPRLLHLGGPTYIPTAMPPVVPRLHLQIAAPSVIQGGQPSTESQARRARLSPLPAACSTPHHLRLPRAPQSDRVTGTEGSKLRHLPAKGHRCDTAPQNRYG